MIAGIVPVVDVGNRDTASFQPRSDVDQASMFGLHHGTDTGDTCPVLCGADGAK